MTKKKIIDEPLEQTENDEPLEPSFGIEPEELQDEDKIQKIFFQLRQKDLP